MVILYERTMTPEGREKLKQMAVSVGAVDDDESE